MHPHETVIRDFYAAFARHDAEAMARCYHDEVFFSDPAFPALHGEEARDMWRMLVSRAADLEIVLEEAGADAAGGRARWTARYTFSKTGRKVVNRIGALFAFKDGRIVRHHDSFSFWRWSAQALGPAGQFLGWFAPLKWMVRRQAARQLARFRQAKEGARGPLAEVRVPGLPDFTLELQAREDKVVTALLRDEGIWEPFESRIVAALLRPGDVFVDLGANIGYYTVLAGLRVGPAGEIHAFEPDPENFRILEANIRRNGVANAHPVQAAAGDADGQGSLYLSTDNQGDHRIYRSGEERSQVPIRIVALDRYLSRVRAPRLVKIDTQGAEVRILRGLHGALSAWQPLPYLIIEFWPFGLRECGDGADALLDLLAPLALDLFEIDENRRALAPVTIADLRRRAATDLHPDTFLHTNLLACPRSGEPPPH